MFWSLDSPEEQTFGQLLAAYRRRRGLSQADVAPLLVHFGFRFPPQISLLEGGAWPAHPDRPLIREFARLYTLSPREETLLLRQADILPSATEQQSIILRFASTMLEFYSPVCILNAHWQLVTWNEPFAAYYDGGDGGNKRPAAPQSQLTDPALWAASAPIHPRTASLPERPGRPDTAAGAELVGDFLSLKENLNFLLLLFSRQSRLRSILAADEWNKLARFFLIRFWRTSLPLFNQHWNPAAGPAWILEAGEEVQALPVPDKQEFLEISDQIRGNLETDGGWADPHAQLTNTFLHDRLIFRQQHRQIQLIPTVMSDARFLCLQFQHCYPPELPDETSQQRYL
ncbi:MAG: helix-turn-helix domain-containing protein [Ktedonobacterales bacterium]